MSFVFNRANYRMHRKVGAVSPNYLNIADAADAGRLYLDLYVYDEPGGTFVATQETLADITTITALQAVTGLRLHDQVAGLAGVNADGSLDVASITVAQNDGNNYVSFTVSPTSYTWPALPADSAGWPLRWVVLRYDDGSGDNIPIAASDEGDVLDKPSVGDDFIVNVSLFFAFNSIEA